MRNANDHFAWVDELANILSVSERTVREWLSRMDKDAKEARDRRIFELWMACNTVEEIAEAVGCDKSEVSRVCCETADLPNFNKPDQTNANHAEEGFQVPIYNVWKRQDTRPSNPGPGCDKLICGTAGQSRSTSGDHVGILQAVATEDRRGDACCRVLAGSGARQKFLRRR